MVCVGRKRARWRATRREWAKSEKRIRFAFWGYSSSDERDDYETPTVEDMAEDLKRLSRFEPED